MVCRGFVFGAMTFLVPRLFESECWCFNRHCRHRSRQWSCGNCICSAVVGRLIDRRAVKPMIDPCSCRAACFRSDGDATGLHFVRSDPAGHGICLGQIPITDDLRLSRYTGSRRTKVLSVKLCSIC